MWLCHPARAHHQVMRGCGTERRLQAGWTLPSPSLLSLGLKCKSSAMATLCTTEDGWEETSTLQVNLPGAGLLSVNGLLWGSGSSKTDFLIQTQVPLWTFCLFVLFWQNWCLHVKHLRSDKERLNKLLWLMGKELYVKNSVVTLLLTKYGLKSLYCKFIFHRYIQEGV